MFTYFVTLYACTLYILYSIYTFYICICFQFTDELFIFDMLTAEAVRETWSVCGQTRRAASPWFHSLVWTMSLTGVVIASAYGVISVLGLIGNITLIKTFCSTKCIRNVPNLFMSSLALGDVLLLLTCAPVDASRYLSERWLFGRVGCKVIPFIQLTSVGVSVFTLTALSADR